jgi:hypothetical protein
MAAVLKVMVQFKLDANAIEIDLMNVGHVFASDIHVDLQVTKRSLPDEKVIGESLSIKYVIPEIGLTQDMWQQREYPLHISDQDMRLIKDTRLTARVEGTLTYMNGFQISTQPVCYTYLTYEERDRAGEIIASSTNPQVPCDEFDISLQSVLREKKRLLEK